MTVATTEFWRMSATDLPEVIRSGQASSQEVIEAHLRRIEAVNPWINATPCARRPIRSSYPKGDGDA
jgi:amidase